MDGLQEYIDKRLREDGKDIPTLDELNVYIGEFMQIRNNQPKEFFEGYSSFEMHMILHNLFGENCPVQLADFAGDIYERIPIFRQVKLLFGILRSEGSIKLTQAGFLPVRIVQELYRTGAPEPNIEDGIVRLRREKDSYSVQITRIACELMHATKKRKNILTLTKAGEKLVADERELLPELLKAMFRNFNPAYFDYYESANIGVLGLGFTLILLDKYGDTERTDGFYADKYLEALPMLISEATDGYTTPEDVARHCYSIRVFDVLLYHLGLVEIEKIDRQRPTYQKTVRRNDLFKELLRILPSN